MIKLSIKRTIQNILAISFVLASFALMPVNADVLFFNDGEEIVGSLKEITNSKIVFEDVDKVIKTYDEEQVSSVLISKIRKGDEISKVDELTDPVAIGILQAQPDSSVFKDAQYATLCRLTDVEYIDESTVKITTREIVKILKEQGLDMANQSFYYYIEREKAELDFAHTYSPDKKVYHITDDAISHEALRISTPEYDKIKKMKMALKKVDLGSVIDYSFSRTITGISETSPFSLTFIFGEREPVMHEELSLTFPENMKLSRVNSQWDQSAAPKFYEKTENGKTNWKWIYADPDGYVGEQSMLPRTRIFPTLTIYKGYPWNETAKILAEGYEKSRPDNDLLEGFIERCNLSAAKTKYEKACKIYEAINKDIRDVSMGPQNMGSYLPLSSNITLTKKYANLQGILALMHFAFEKAGIESYPGFAGSKRNRVTVKENPNLELAVNPVLKVIIDNKAFYTNGGSSYLPFGYLVTDLQGADAVFFDIKKGESFLETLPQQTFDWNRETKNIYVKLLDNGTMEVKQTTMAKGPYESACRKIKSLKDKEKQNYAEKWVKSIHSNAILESFGHSDLEDLNAPVVLNLCYTIPNAAQMASDKIMTFTNLWTNYSSSSASLEKRKFPMSYWATEDVRKTIVFDLPEGFEWVKWGKQYQHISPEFKFASNFYAIGRQLIYSEEFTATVDELLSDEAYQNYRNCLLTMAELGNQWIIIEKTEKLAKSEEVEKTEETVKSEEDTQVLPDGETEEGDTL
ncbi:MAG: DUF3857 domain-containing protein [Candidatus Riflebacteria bacterium]|nr:DUF3857 domain-containing protein [Candidatus Riflebacteria bacterium]